MITKKRWLYLITATLVLLFLGLIYAWSIFTAPFSAVFPDWSVSQLSMTFTISISFFCLGGFAGGLLSKKLKTRVRILIAAVMLFVGFFVVSTLNPANSAASLIKLYIFYGVFGGGGVGLIYNALISTVNRWFPGKVGFASGVMLMGFGLGGLALGAITNSLIASVGLFTAFKILSIAIGVISLVAAMLIRLPKDEELEVLNAQIKNETKDNNENTSEDKSLSADYTPSEMLRTPSFWFFVLWVVLLNAAALLVINSAANISIAFGGSAVLGLIVSLFNGGGRIIAGNNFDKFGIKTSTFVNSAFMMTAGLLLVAGSFTGKFILIVTGLIFVGLAFGGCPTITSAYINKAYGTKNFPLNFSITNFSLIPAAITGPMLSSKLLESAGGNYITNFFAVIGFSVAAGIMWFFLNISSKKKD